MLDVLCLCYLGRIVHLDISVFLDEVLEALCLFHCLFHCLEEDWWQALVSGSWTLLLLLAVVLVLRNRGLVEDT